jgi:hypothetical protein
MKRLSMAVTVTLTFALVGCDSGPITHPVSGKITIDGKQPPAGTKIDVAFVPVSGGSIAQTEADPSGQFTLVSANGSPGTQPGKYRVGITCMLSTPPAPSKGGETEVKLGSEPFESRQEVEVKPSDNSFTFDVPTPPRGRR